MDKEKLNKVVILITKLSLVCEADPYEIIDHLTGHLWNEEEAGSIRREIDEL